MKSQRESRQAWRDGAQDFTDVCVLGNASDDFAETAAPARAARANWRRVLPNESRREEKIAMR
jgi:hypothetical protein